MNIFNGFISIPELADNRVGEIAKFGELSSSARTYSRDIRNYANKNTYPGLELVTFNFLDNASRTVNNPSAKVPEYALRISHFLYTQYINNQIPLPNAKNTLLTAVKNEFKELRNVSISQILDGDETGKRLIDHIRYDVVVDNVEWRCTVWFSDHWFKRQYPLYEIEIIPPVGDVRRLDDTAVNVADALSSIEIDYVVNRVSAITQKDPMTALHVYETPWQDRDNAKNKLPTKWTIVIYGAAGNDQDVIKDAIREYLAIEGSGIDWTKIFPDLFSENEFLLMPYWGNLSTPTDGVDDGLYSSITSLESMYEDMQRNVPASYGVKDAKKKDFINEAFSIIGTTYRGINIGVIGNPNNREAKYRFADIFPDYMSVATDKSDFARMKRSTQFFIIRLLEALEIARDYTLTTQLGANYSRTVKANREYIGFEYEGYNFYLLTRLGYLKEL